MSASPNRSYEDGRRARELRIAERAAREAAYHSRLADAYELEFQIRSIVGQLEDRAKALLNPIATPSVGDLL